MNGPLASVIVPNRNGARVLDRCLRQLNAQDHEPFEIIVVDDASTDESIRVAERHLDGERLTIVRSDRHRGLGAARNLGLRHARGRYVAYIDADGYAASDWLRHGVAALERDPGLGAVASLVFFDGNRTVLNGAGGTMNRYGYGRDNGFNEPLEHARLPTEVVYPMGCGMITRREALERVGGFDPLFQNYYDDAELGLKLWGAGYRVELAPDAWIDHGYGHSTESSEEKMLFCERHRIRTVLKHYPLRALPRWLMREAASITGFPSIERTRRRAAWAWNLPRLPSAVLAHVRARPGVHRRPPFTSEPAPYPPPTQLSRPSPDQARFRLRLDGVTDLGPLIYGFYPGQTHDGRRFRWMTDHGALLMRARRETHRLAIDYMVALYGTHVAVEVRPIGERESIWSGQLADGGPPHAWAQAELPVRLRAGTYVVAMATSPTARSIDGAVLGLGLASVELT